MGLLRRIGLDKEVEGEKMIPFIRGVLLGRRRM